MANEMKLVPNDLVKDFNDVFGRTNEEAMEAIQARHDMVLEEMEAAD